MNNEISDLRGCLSQLKTLQGRRRYSESEEEATHSTMFVTKKEDEFLVDEIRILCSKAYRRLTGKTQVTCLPRNPHIRNRLTHTMEVVACSVNVSEMLGLNTNLVRAIALGHDLGHAPFGHPGEAYLAERTGKPYTHEIMGVVLVQHIERRCKGLNLTHEVLDGMMRHSGKNVSDSMTPEAWVVRYADKFAYIFADYNDFIRMQWKVDSELVSLMNDFGESQRQRVLKVILELARESAVEGKVSFVKCDVAQKFNRLRELMYHEYPKVTLQNPHRALDPIYDFVDRLKIGDPLLIISLMTDQDVNYLLQQYALNFDHIRSTAVGELIEVIKDKKIDCCDPDLDW
ncbi:MAG: hypothetical protein A3C79_00330 [Candidatus Taylorbacteria bacterium RIFCSPHIGHO2_02_FULL_45_28]|uniref:HD domain-containing protein n=1 Tax=Candidatus Taylorbacteria bacterium RIFCSPHIGHO2_12_FULL_45_16 TaxID=1802315 RepID=A0A1G2MZ73_9BACT|nr:MAG: hypothetical protein A2830_01585 [Candidatus Taylorbacteria bacterium RIFCSPHIGHO2_01_FULL_44_110]OHA25471.1 MAG: hypothetical protein A3C79_00330 [Candidatus Taylorbacteria bacterium RIFCSPHIGHO2_02_FULL_45_28]OHA29138.1 MAG: hypothetical protein A3F51_00795 [Candidatus Taylorbacteria bacterium RIFCSPHIGHO2_12_FULL_45_16]OHA33360.1 MAG: hypothetical protein A3A23_01675 [Candidatus Taylorbacteria bacterium RIFCSPLOWO2_01_FULL_45_59]OHA38728.1 MAG: hypothetical protein A3I98_03430 [Candi